MMNATAPPIVPVLLSGGSGTRLWPLSRQSLPKQFHALAGTDTLLQQAALRVADRTRFAAPIVIAAAEHRFLVAEQLRAIGCDDARIVLEPVGRNTAPAIAAAAVLAQRDHPQGLLLAMPADHVIADPDAFRATVDRAARVAADGALTLFGIRPDRPATGYGYIEPGRATGPGSTANTVARFVEKPERDIAETLVTRGCLWNSGIFLLPLLTLNAEMTRYAPEVLEGARNAVASSSRDLDFIRLGEAAFGGCPSISIDYAVMEKTDQAAVIAADFAWTDVGAWSALWDIGQRDAEGNVYVGDAVAEQCHDCYLHGEGVLVAAFGLRDLIVVATGDAVLVVPREAEQSVRTLVERLRSDGRIQATQAAVVHRPWGNFESVDAGERFQVKRIAVHPGHSISLQRHRHRAEHWVVVNGSARVQIGDDVRTLEENESVFIPAGTVHRLTNPGPGPLNLIEVQSGSYLGEDDIERLSDDYART